MKLYSIANFRAILSTTPSVEMKQQAMLFPSQSIFALFALSHKTEAQQNGKPWWGPQLHKTEAGTLLGYKMCWVVPGINGFVTVVAGRLVAEEPSQPDVERVCPNCVHCKTWNFRGTLEEPPDSGMECQLVSTDDGHPINTLLDAYEEELGEVNEQFAQVCSYFKARPGAGIPEPEPDFTHPVPLELQREILTTAGLENLQELGFLDEDGQPTDAYFTASDFAYDAQREQR